MILAVPARLLLQSIDTLCPAILQIVNLSLETAFFPPKLKEAALNPVLKRHNLNYPEFANFSSISNLGFLSKVLIEKVVANQTIIVTLKITIYMNVSNLGLQKIS